MKKILLTFILLAALITGCTGNNGNNTDNPTPDNAGAENRTAPVAQTPNPALNVPEKAYIPPEMKGKITVSMLDDSELINSAAKLFMDKYPEVKVAVNTFRKVDTVKLEGGAEMSGTPSEEFSTENYLNLLNTKIMTGKAEDIIMTDPIPFKKYTDMGAFEDLYFFLSHSPGINDESHYMNAFEIMKDKSGRLYQIPLTWNPAQIISFDKQLVKPETKRLANILNRLVNGSAKTFSQHTNVNLDNKYTVLDISELSGDLLTVGMFVALDYVWDKAKEDRTVEKAIFIDEAWQLIGASSNTLAAEFVLEIFKIIRGYGGAAICASQDLNDFFALENGKFGKGIINNAKTKIILNLEDEEAQRVQEVMHLSDAEIMAITYFQRGNGLISTNNNNVSVEFRASSYEKELVTSDRQELQEILQRKQEHTLK